LQQGDNIVSNDLARRVEAGGEDVNDHIDAAYAIDQFQDLERLLIR